METQANKDTISLKEAMRFAEWCSVHGWEFSEAMGDIWVSKDNGFNSHTSETLYKLYKTNE